MDRPEHPTPGDVDTIAASFFGFTLRPAQRAALAPVTQGRDTLAVLPTGSGKSAIYQIGGLALGGLTVVVSPLIALQRDQLRALCTGDSGPRAATLNSTQHKAERNAALAALDAGTLDFLLLGPEQLANAETHRHLAGGPRPVRLLVVDEAHLVSEWGHDFRPEYLRLPETVAAVGRPVILALTATAAPPVQADITRQLHMDRPAIVVTGFDRPNIALAVRNTHNHLPEAQAVDDRTVEVAIDHETPMLVYALSHVRCESLAERLNNDAFRASPYHAGMPAAQRARVQDAFFTGKLDIVVATSAFGMGIDKSDVRTVVHAGVPGSLDEYYQEIGRAGRDGQAASAVLVYDPRTIRIPRLLAARAVMPVEMLHRVVDALEAASGPTSIAEVATASGVSRQRVERVISELNELGILSAADGGLVTPQRLPADAATRLEQAGARRHAIVASRIDSARLYAESVHCRRTELLSYFGDHYEPPCNHCDNDLYRGGPAVRPTVHSAHPTISAPSGQRVEHRVWGSGTLISRDEHELVVVFDSLGYRHLTPAVLTNGILTLV